jgi:adenylate cyclase class IV
MHEIEFVVDSFERAEAFLRALGLITKHYFENKRTRYIQDGIAFDIDEWQLTQPYLEIEAQSWEEVDTLPLVKR